MSRSLLRFFRTLLLVQAALVLAQDTPADRPPIMLPSSKMLTVPSPGALATPASFPVTMVVSPDARYAALLNDGYGTQETLAQRSRSPSC